MGKPFDTEPGEGVTPWVRARDIPKPIDPPSWWMGTDREMFTVRCIQLFEQRKPKTVTQMDTIHLQNAARLGVL